MELLLGWYLGLFVLCVIIHISKVMDSVWLEIKRFFINVAAQRLKYMLMRLHKLRKLWRWVICDPGLVFLHFAQFLICLYLLTGHSLPRWWKLCVLGWKRGLPNSSEYWYEERTWPSGMSSFLYLFYFVAKIICSFAGFVQANFLQAAVDHKKKIGFKGNSVLFLYDYLFQCP
jgi:hypothetical protein